jgi:hypothetical protein
VAYLCLVRPSADTVMSNPRRILWFPATLIVLGVLIWIGGLAVQLSSSSQRDASHTIAVVSHGTTNYVSSLVYCIPWVGLGIGVIGVLSYWILSRRIAARLGVSVDSIMGASQK